MEKTVDLLHPLQQNDEKRHKDALHSTSTLLSTTSSEDQPIGLKRQITLPGMIAFIVGAIIGAGIFASPRSVAAYSGSTGGILITWVASGGIAAIGAVIFCELGLTFPENCAGEYTYIFEAFGELPAFVTLYLQMLTRPAALALVSIVVGDYIMVAVTGEGDSGYSKAIGAGIIMVHMVFNCYSVKWVERIQIFFTSAKMIPVLLLIVTGFVRISQGHTGNFKNAFNGTSTSVSDIAFALYGGLWAYAGWDTMNFLTAEAENPLRDIPIAISVAIPLVIVCYVLVNISYLTVRSPVQICNSGAIAVEIGEQLYGFMHWCVPALVACSVFGSSNGQSFRCARVFYEAANRKQLPAIIGSVHRRKHTPIPAIVLVSIISCVILVPDATNFKTLLNFVQSLHWVQLSLSVAAMMWLRKFRPDLKRPLKIFIGIPLFFFFITLFLVAAPFFKYPLQQMYGVCVLLPSVPIYCAFVKYQVLPKRFLRQLDELTSTVQKFGNLANPNDDSSFDEAFKDAGQKM